MRNEPGAEIGRNSHPQELAVEHVPDAVNIPRDEVLGRLDEPPRDGEVLVICHSSQRAC